MTEFLKLKSRDLLINSQRIFVTFFVFLFLEIRFRCRHLWHTLFYKFSTDPSTFQFIHSFIFRSRFIPVKIAVDSEPIPDVKREYTLNGT